MYQCKYEVLYPNLEGYKKYNFSYTLEDLKVLCSDYLSEVVSGGSKIRIDTSNKEIVSELFDHYGGNNNFKFSCSYDEQNISQIVAFFLDEGKFHCSSSVGSPFDLGLFYYYILPYECVKIITNKIDFRKGNFPDIKESLISYKDQRIFNWRVKIQK